MIKRIIGIALIAVLGIILIVNIIQQDSANEDFELQDANEQTTESLAKEMEEMGLDVGEVAPDFELETIDGEMVRLSDLRGKKVFLNFWATWCPPCKEEMPEMQDFHDEYGEEVEILAVNTTGSERNEQVVGEFIDEYDYTFTTLLNTDMHVVDEYMAISIPTTYFIGTDGVIQQQRKVGPMTYDFMEEMMNELN